MRIQILGCGSSTGVPVLGCSCIVCKSKNPKNKRMRQSIYIEHKGTKILIDPGPDFRRQCLENNISKLDGILFTHAHQDHVGGFDDIGPFARSRSSALNLYLDEATLKTIKARFYYLFEGPLGAYYSNLLKLNIIKSDQTYYCEDIEFWPFHQQHGGIKSLGFKISQCAYSTDLSVLGDAEFELLHGIDLWIIECQSYKAMDTHLHLDKTLEFISRAKAKKAVLMHMSHAIDYDEIISKLPAHVSPAYDGMVITLP